MVTQFTIIDKNDFGNVLLSRAFTHPEDGHDWAVGQIALIIEALKRNGEDLLDIEYEHHALSLDDETLDQRNWNRR